ncbi:hypothetical protein KKB18_13080 [bacterium]|nr:hypothetical protein [bacterium]
MSKKSTTLLFPFIVYFLCINNLSSKDINTKSSDENRHYLLELIKSPHFEIRFESRDRFYANLIMKTAENAYQKTKDSITDKEINIIWVYITRTQEQFDRFRLLTVKPPDWAAGLTFPGYNYILLKSPAALKGEIARETLLTTFRHELAHVFLHSAANRFYDKIPRWFDEGFATFQANEWYFSKLSTLSVAGLLNTYIPFDYLTYDFPLDEDKALLAYAQSYSFVSYLYEKYHSDSIKGIIKELSKGKNFPEAVKFILDKDLKYLEGQWRKRARAYYTWIPLITSTTTLWFIIAFIVTFGFVKRRKRYKEALDRMEEEELQEFFH